MGPFEQQNQQEDFRLNLNSINRHQKILISNDSNSGNANQYIESVAQ